MIMGNPYSVFIDQRIWANLLGTEKNMLTRQIAATSTFRIGYL